METIPVRVLLVEDNPADARFLSIQLSASDALRFTLTHVERLSAAVEHLQRAAVDLILLDLSLPDAHGLETVRGIQSAAADIPVVVLTGYSDESFALQAMREGAQDYLFKGQLDRDLLVRSMRYAIERHRLLRGQKLAERALKASEEFARNIIDSSLDMIIAVDNDRRIIQFNRAAEQAFGYGRTEVLGRDVAMLYADPEEGMRVHRLTLELGRCVQEVTNRRKDGEIFPTLISASPLCNAHGQPVGLMGISRDITERKRAEAALRKAHEELELRVQERTADLMQANAALQAEAAERRLIEADLAKARDEALSSARVKAEFLANMSHEIRTPMNGVLGMTNLLLNTNLTQQQRDCAENIRESAHALLKIINDILDFSKIEAGKLTFDIEDFDLVDAVEGTLELLADPAQAKGLELVASIAPDVPRRLSGDPVRLRQVLTNLVSNAVKFTESGEVSLRVRKQSETGDDVTLRIEVRDTGIGIAQDVQRRLFQAFSQADGSTTRKYGGTGLGLAISKQLVALMNGEIGLESEPGRGTLFWFHVQLGKQRMPTPEGPQIKSRPGSRVLIAASNDTFHTAIEDQLRVWGFKPESARTEQRILGALDDGVRIGDPFSVLLLDGANRALNALEIVRNIKSNVRYHRTRVVLFTTLRERANTELFQRAGVDSCLVKPVRQGRLYDCLTSILDCSESTSGRAASNRMMLEETPAGISPERRPVRVLVAEDNPINQKVAAGQLKAFGYASEIVGTGEDVLEALRRGDFDLILMDCQMPVMDGYEAARRIRSSADQPWRGIPIIAMTANAMQGDREKCLAAGMNDYLSKPIDEDELKAALERWHPREPLRGRAQAESWRVDSCGNATSGAINAGKECVDFQRLTKVSCGSREKARALVELYLEQAGQAMTGLRRAIDSNAPAEVEQIAHRCRGASSTCGVTALLSPLRELERLGREQSLSDAPRILEEASRTLQKVQAFLDQYLDETSNETSSDH